MNAALYAILSVSLVISARADYGRSRSSEVSRKDRPRRQCCLPQQYEGRVEELLAFGGPQPGSSQVDATFAYDFRKKLAAMVEEVSVGSVSQAYKIIANYGSQTIYFVYKSRNGTCVKMALPASSELQQCVPKNATVGPPKKFGGSLQARTYRVERRSDLVSLALGLTATESERDCLPITEAGVGTFNSTLPIVFSAQFYDQRNKIADPKIFTPPTNCSDATGQDIAELSLMMQFFVAKLVAV